MHTLHVSIAAQVLSYLRLFFSLRLQMYEFRFFNKPFSFMLKIKFRGICIYSPTLSSFEELE